MKELILLVLWVRHVWHYEIDPFLWKKSPFLSALLGHIGHPELHLKVLEILKFWPILVNFVRIFALFGVLLRQWCPKIDKYQV